MASCLDKRYTLRHYVRQVKQVTASISAKFIGVSRRITLPGRKPSNRHTPFSYEVHEVQHHDPRTNAPKSHPQRQRYTRTSISTTFMGIIVHVTLAITFPQPPGIAGPAGRSEALCTSPGHAVLSRHHPVQEDLHEVQEGHHPVQVCSSNG